jgi:hypothetical protein
MSHLNLTELKFKLQPKPKVPEPGPEELYQQGDGRLPRITQVLALAIYLEQMIMDEEAKDYADVARLAGLCRERISQVMRLLCLAPNIQVELLYLPATPTGQFPISETAIRKIASELLWDEQRRQWAELKRKHGLG